MKLLSIPEVWYAETRVLLLRVVYFLSLLVGCSSCASVYVSSVRNTPLMMGRGEFQGSASFGNGANVNAAYALTDHVGITAGGMYANNRVQSVDNSYRRHQSAELGLGYFGHTKKLSYELFAGYGAGRGFAQDSVWGFIFFANSQVTTEGGYDKFYIQPTFAFRPKRFFLAVTMRFTYVAFQDIQVTTDNRNPSIFPGKYTYVFEPCFTAKYFFTNEPKSLFVFTQVGFNVADQREDLEYSLPFFMPHYNFGIGFRMGRGEEKMRR